MSQNDGQETYSAPQIDFWTPRRKASFTFGLILTFCLSLAFGFLHHP